MTTRFEKAAGWGIAIFVLAACGDLPTESSADPSDFAWTTPELIPGLADALRDGRHHVASGGALVGADGRLHLTYMVAREGTKLGRWNEILYVAAGTSGWGPVESLSDTITYSHAPRLAVDAGGRIHIFWYEWSNGSGAGDAGIIAHRTKEKQGRWSDVHELVQLQSPVDYLALGAGTDDGGGVHVLHTGAGGGTFGHVQIGEGGTSASTSTRLAFGGTSPSPCMSCGGRVDLAYVEAYLPPEGGSGRSDVWAVRYNGAEWGEPDLVHNDPDEYSYTPLVLGNESEHRHLVWAESAGGGGGTARRLFHAYSKGPASEWSEPRDITPESFNDHLIWNLNGFVDGRGRPNIVFERTDPGSLANARILQMRLENEGWRTPWFPVGDRPARAHAVAPGEDGRVHMILRMLTGDARPDPIYHAVGRDR